MPINPNVELLEAGKRIADAVNARLTFSNPFDVRHCWMAFDLNDGTSRGELYDTLPDAKRHTDEWKTAYIQLMGVLGGLTPRDAAIYLDWCRKARDANLGHKDPRVHTFMGPVTRG